MDVPPPPAPHRPDITQVPPDRLHLFLLIVFVLNGLMSIIAFYKYYDAKDQIEAYEQNMKLKDQTISQLNFQLKQVQTISANNLDKSSDTTTKCRKVLSQDTKSYTYCHLTGVSKTDSDMLIGENVPSIYHVANFTISPDSKRILVSRYSDAYLAKGGTPVENTLMMVDIETAKLTTYFTRIFFPNFVGGIVTGDTQAGRSSWSTTTTGVVFTAGAAAIPDLIKDVDPFAVVYCETTCRILAKDAGPYGNGAAPAYFDHENVVYSDKAGTTINLPFK